MAEPTDKLGMAAEWETPTPAPSADKPETQTPAPPQKFAREINVGGRVQRFEGDTQEELIDKLTQAQENATRKLQELSQATRKPMQPEQRSSDWTELKAITDGQNAESANEFRRMFQSEIGLTPGDWLKQENARRQRDAEMDAAREFLKKHEGDYTPTPQNEQKILELLKRENLPFSKRNLDYAFGELREELVVMRPVQAPAVSAPETKPVPPAPEKVSSPPSFIRPSLGGPRQGNADGTPDAAEVARISQLPPAEMKASIEQLFRASRMVR